MSNINDYLDWRGDLSFDVSPLNEVDGMILSRISYLPFTEIKMKEQDTIENVMKKIVEVDEKEFNIEGDVLLAQKLLKSKRFNKIILSDFVIDNDEDAEKQFSAVTLHLPSGDLYISYCGTDNSLVGWKEDFNLSFMDHIPAQLDGVRYLKNIAKKYKGRIYLGGHSKGGNVAVFSGAYAGKTLQKRIIQVTNHDGPGFVENVTNSEEYKSILDKVRTYIPQDSIIGRLMEHSEKYQVVYSVEKGVMQHDIYSWQVLGTKIIKEEKVTNGSEFINDTITEWVKSVPPKERKKFIGVIYSLIESTNAKTCKEFSKSKIRNLNKMLKSYKNIDEDDKKMISQIMKLLIASAKDSLKHNYNQTSQASQA